jgi:anthranilate synthase component 2
MSGIKDKILIIDNYDSFTFNLTQIVEELNYDYCVIKNDTVLREEVDQFSKILISPGPGTPSEAGFLNDIILKYADSKSILGVCLGHQAIASVFGAELYNLNNVRHGVAVEIKITDHDDYLFENIPYHFDAGLYHSWAVSGDNFPDCLKATSYCDNNIMMSLAHRSYDLRGVQFHPESIMTAYGRRIIRNWLVH